MFKSLKFFLRANHSFENFCIEITYKLKYGRKLNVCPSSNKSATTWETRDPSTHQHGWNTWFINCLRAKNQLSKRFSTVTCHARQCDQHPLVYYYPANFGRMNFYFNLLIEVPVETVPCRRILIQFAFIKSSGPQERHTFVCTCGPNIHRARMFRSILGWASTFSKYYR